jgi:hypothetical protein
MKKLILLATITTALGLGSAAQAGSWGFQLGNGSGFYYNQGRPACAPVYSVPAYVAPAPVYYSRPTVVYSRPQTVYMQPYQQMRPTYYPQTVIYRSEPVVIRESHRRCGSRW